MTKKIFDNFVNNVRTFPKNIVILGNKYNLPETKAKYFARLISDVKRNNKVVNRKNLLVAALADDAFDAQVITQKRIKNKKK